MIPLGLRAGVYMLLSGACLGVGTITRPLWGIEYYIVCLFYYQNSDGLTREGMVVIIVLWCLSWVLVVIYSFGAPCFCVIV